MTENAGFSTETEVERPVKSKKGAKALPDFEWPTIRTKHLFDLLDINPKTLQNLRIQGKLPNIREGLYDLRSSVRAYIQHLRETRGGQGAKPTSVATSELQQNKATLAALDIAKRSGVLKRAAVAEAISVADEIIGGMRAELAAMPARVTRDNDLRDGIRAELDRIFAAHAERIERARADQDGSSEAFEA